MVQVAKRGASVLKRRKSRNRMETPSGIAAANATAASGSGGPSSVTASGGITASTSTGLQYQQSTNDAHASGSGHAAMRSESDGDVVFYVEDPRGGKFSQFN